MTKKNTKETTNLAEKCRNVARKHELFVENYLLHFNATEAYKQTYGLKSDTVAASNGSALLRQPDVKQYLEKRLAERKEELSVDASYIVRKYLEIIETDYTEGIQELSKDQLQKMPKALRKLIQSVEIVKTSTRTDRSDYESERYKVTFMSKDKAAEAIGKHTGTFMKDNITANVNLDQMTFTDALKQLDIQQRNLK